MRRLTIGWLYPRLMGTYGDRGNITALLNVALVLAHNVGEYPAREAIQAGIFAMAEIKGRPGPRYAMNARQREFVMQAVDLAVQRLEFGGAVVQLLQMPPRHVFAFGVQTFQLVPFCLDHGHLASILLPRQIECHLE